MRIYVHLLLLFVVISTILLLGSCQTTPSSNNEDREALLDLKSFITSDPSGALSSWGNGSSECTWTGVNCKNGGRVTELDLKALNLVGTISPHIGNLTALPLPETGCLPSARWFAECCFSGTRQRRLCRVFFFYTRQRGSFPSVFF